MNVIYASLVSFRPQDADGFIDATLIEKPIISVSSSAAALLGARTPLNSSTLGTGRPEQSMACVSSVARAH